MAEVKPIIKKYRLDALVIAAVLILSLILLLIVNLTKTEGAIAVVEIDGVTVSEYRLSENGEYLLNGGTNRLVIEDGCAYLNYSNCPDHTCENTGKVKYVGQTVVCLPNRLTVTVVGTSDNSVDLVS